MLYKLHYWFLTAGASALGLLMGVFIETYTDASSFEIGALFMLMPFTGIVFRPIICAMADREQAHKKYLLICLMVSAISYSPFILIPHLGPQVYEAHPRVCWYVLISFKIMGDIGFGGIVSIGDSLAINYANRVGVEFSVYRVWGTLSWMLFGLIIGQINETSVMPKFVPAFVILVTCNILHTFLVWIWPDEYFVMVAARSQPTKRLEDGNDKNDGRVVATISGGGGDDKEQAKAKGETSFASDLTKSLMPKEIVLARMRAKLMAVICCGTRKASRSEDATQHQKSSYLAAEDGGAQAATTTGKASQGHHLPMPESPSSAEKAESSRQRVNKSTQLRILAKLLRRDPRIALYLIFFTLIGFGMAPVSFLFMNISSICHTEHTCDFSPLVGWMMATMAGAETILFIYIKRIKASIGRVNTCTLALLLLAMKYMFYGTVWTHVSPYYALLAETVHGVVFGIGLTMMAELGYLFANEVEYILPELNRDGLIDARSDPEVLKLALSATMQALLSVANDGTGRGFGALIYGFILDKYSYETLWLVIGIGATVSFVCALSVNLLDRLYNFQLGLDVRAARKQQQLEEPQQQRQVH